MSRETMVKTPDGIVTRDIEYTKATSDSLDTAKNIRQRVLHWAPRVLLGFIVACVVFYCYQVLSLYILLPCVFITSYFPSYMTELEKRTYLQ